MPPLRRFILRLYSFIRPSRAEDQATREIAAHLALLEDDYRSRGLSPEDARVAARRAFGSVERARDEQRDTRSFVWLEGVRQDGRHACRLLLKTPGFALAAISTLAIGIGASTAIFSVAYGVSMRPLPYPDPDRLVRIYEANLAQNDPKHDVSMGAFQEWREGAPAIERGALYGKASVRFLAGPDPQPLTRMSVSPALFDVLGVRPLLGPGFRPEQQYTRFNADDEAVVSHGLWQRLFGGRPDIIGQQLEFTGVGDNDVLRIVGVMPKGFAFDQPVDLWQPTLIVEPPVGRLLRQWRYDRAVARLRPGATLEQARVELEAVSTRLAVEFPATNDGWTVTVETLHDSIVGQFARAAWLLLAAVGAVLLVASLNVGGLLVSRAVARQRETAVRVALGAGPWRLVRLWLAEAAFIGTLGAAFGIGLAWIGVRALKVAAPPGIPRLDAIALDMPVLAAAIAAALLAIVVSTMAPIGIALRRDLANGLRAGSAGSGEAPTRQRVRHALMVGQCAGASLLVILAFMLTRSFVTLTSVDLGWRASGVLSLRVIPRMPKELRRPWARYVEWSDRLTATLERTPGLERAAITTQVPLSALVHAGTVARGKGKQHSEGAQLPSVTHSVSDGYFDVMGIGLVAGRGFDARDRFNATQLIDSDYRPDWGVAIVSESVARQLWPGSSAIGQALWLPNIDNVTWRKVIGVVEDIHFNAVGETPALHVFVPWTQFPSGNPKLVVKGAGTGLSIAPVVRQVVESVEPGTQVDQVLPLDALVSRATAQPRFTTRVVALFGGVALLLAAVGIYGTLSYIVRARSREIGIRLTLGASGRHILWTTAWRGLAPAIAGGVVGVLSAVALSRTFQSLFFEAVPIDVVSMAGGALLLAAAALVAAIGPARRAAGVDPAVTLRAE